jgi:tetratricopeptide (TPR) repeat protein
LCLAIATFFLAAQGKQERVLKTYNEVEELIYESDQGWEFAWIRVIENFTNYASDWNRMYENAKRALTIFEKLEDDFAVTYTYNILASRSIGNTKKAYCQKALTNAKKHNGALEIAWALLEFGRLEIEQGNYKKADAYLTEAYSRNSAIHFLHQKVNTLRFLGISAQKQGKYTKTREYCERAKSICKRAGLEIYIAECNELLSAAAVGMGDNDSGRKLINEALTFWIDSFGDELPFGPSPPEIYVLLENLGYPDLAVIEIINSPGTLFGEEWKLENEKLLEEIKSRYSQEEIEKWIERAGQIKPIELAKAFQDALSGD